MKRDATAPPTPDPSFQCEFLERIQRLLAEGQFTATYKFALLHAIADLCVEEGSRIGGGSLTISIDALADHFVELYRRQARPFVGRDETGILKQNTGRQARVVTVLADHAAPRGGGRPGAVPRRVLSEIHETIRDQPLWKLQTLAGGDRFVFLYENVDRYAVREVTLRPGIAYCFRTFHGLIVSMVRDRWEQWVRTHNGGILGHRADLRKFLFGSERSDLSAPRRALLDVQGRSCFYTRRAISTEIVVDHFVPWSRYPVDLGHNLVLTSQATNARKSDFVAAEDHLERWLEACIGRRDELAAAFDAQGVSHALPASLAIAEWSYEGIERSGGRVWHRGKELSPLTGRWRRLIDHARQALAE